MKNYGVDPGLDEETIKKDIALMRIWSNLEAKNQDSSAKDDKNEEEEDQSEEIEDNK